MHTSPHGKQNVLERQYHKADLRSPTCSNLGRGQQVCLVDDACFAALANLDFPAFLLVFGCFHVHQYQLLDWLSNVSQHALNICLHLHLIPMHLCYGLAQLTFPTEARVRSETGCASNRIDYLTLPCYIAVQRSALCAESIRVCSSPQHSCRCVI